jgi:hypothetical protein
MKFRSISVLALSLVPMLGEAFNYELTSDMSGRSVLENEGVFLDGVLFRLFAKDPFPVLR